MITIFIFTLFACSSTPSTVDSGRAVQAALLANMVETVDAIRSADPTVAADADKLITVFRDQFAPLNFTESGSQMTIRGVAPCRLTDSRCFGFAVPHNHEGNRNLGGWMDGPAMLFIADALSANDLMAPFVAFHELRHNAQFQQHQPPDPLPRVSGERWPRERDATEFEIRLERAASQGRFDLVVNDLVRREQAHTLHTVTFGNVEYPALDGKAAAIMPGLSPIGVDLLNVSIIYAFNVALFTNTNEEVRERSISTLQIGLGQPEVNALYHH